MQICGAMQDGLQTGLRAGLKQRGAPFVGRFIGKLLVDAAPAALASLVGGFLFTQYQYGRPPQPTTVQITPASAEMMQLLRDEHTAIVDYLRAQVSSEKNRQAVENQEDAVAVADARATAEAKAAAVAAAESKAAADAKATADAKIAADAKALAAAATRRLSVAAIAAPTAPKPARTKPAAMPAPTTVAMTTHEPMVIASADAATAPPSDRLARDPDSLLAKTLDLKDHVVAATKNVVSAIGEFPGWIADRITPSSQPAVPAPAPAPRQFAS
jgi:hypothetical protein